MNTSKLRDAAKTALLVCPEKAGEKIADLLNGAAHEIDRLRNELSVAERAKDDLREIMTDLAKGLSESVE